jgi:4-amino-4-deoxy-L-arabinose transferase
MQYGELIYLAVIWITWRGVRRRRAVYYALLAWFWIPYLFFSVAATKMQAYTLIAAPAVFVMNALALVHLQQSIKQKKKYQYILIPVWIALIALPVRYTIERLKPFAVTDRNPAWYQAIIALGQSPLNQPKTVLFNCPQPIETMFFTDCIAYEQAIDSATQLKLMKQGYNVLRCPGH